MRDFAQGLRARNREHLISLAAMGMSPFGSGTWTVWRHGRVLVGLAALVGLGAVGAARLTPSSHGLVAVAFPPWVDAEMAAEKILRAGGVTVSASASRRVTMAIAADRDFRNALRREGAVLILDGPAVRAIDARLTRIAEGL